jgi:hypothetical protein
MAQPIDHDGVSGTATVAGSTLKGAAAGAAAVPLGIMAAAALAVGAVALALIFPVLLIPLVVVGAVAAFTAPVWMTAMGIGAAVGLGSGISKVGREQRAFDERAQALQPQMQPAIDHQAIYQAGAQDGANQVFSKLQQYQEMQMQQEAATMQAAQSAQAEKSFYVPSVSSEPNSILEATPVPPQNVVEQHAHTINASIHEHPNGERRADLVAKYNIKRGLAPQDIIAQRDAVAGAENVMGG